MAGRKAADVAARCGLSPSFFSRIKTDAAPVPDRVLEPLAEALELDGVDRVRFLELGLMAPIKDRALRERFEARLEGLIASEAKLRAIEPHLEGLEGLKNND